MSTEIFNTATWNFLTGNRDVESIIRTYPNDSLVVRGGLATVLPTVNCLRDLSVSGWKDFPSIPILTPANAITSFSPPLNEPVHNGDTYQVLLKKSYGVKVLDRAASVSNSLIVAVDDLGKIPPIAKMAEEMMANGNNNRLVIVPPSPGNLSKAMLGLNPRARFSTTFEGNNVFFKEQVEEAAWDYEPETIVVIGTDPVRVFYSSIGAADWFIVNDSRFRNPQELQLWDLVALGNRVTAIMPEVHYVSKNGATPLKDAVLKHVKSKLGVSSTDDDYRFTPVPGHKIAIDFISN